ncbi:MAG: SemiSWEET transporter [Saprospiraceae bacterium]|nr:SemiSWEET transporter [Saprospiraceae bacterium]
MISTEWIGLVAGLLTTISFIPQVYRTWKTRSAEDLSLGMFLLFTTGVVLWLIYGFIINDLPIILANIVTLSLAGTLLVFKLVFSSKKKTLP